MDEIVVPIPDMRTQTVLAQTSNELAAAGKRLWELDGTIWDHPDLAGEARRTAQKVLAQSDLRDWAESLPYPLASSLRTVETMAKDDHGAARQLVHFWEATVELLASYLLSAIQQDEPLWEEEAFLLREALRKANLSFARATFGTWRVTVERLSCRFREGLASSDLDEQARYRQLLGNPPRELADRLLGTELVSLISRANKRRNEWDGHGGTTSAADARRQRDAWITLTQELRDVIGTRWEDFPLVRAAHMAYDGSRFQVDAERVMGPTTPFIRDQLDLDRPLEAGRLFFVSPGAGAVALAPFVQLSSAVDDPEYTCYFYNRTEGSKVRMVSYHLASSTDMTGDSPEVAALVELLEGSGSTA